MTEPSTQGAEAPPLSLEEELQGIIDRATPKQREWLEQLPKSSWQPYGAANRLSISSHTVWKWLMQDDIARYMELVKARCKEAIGFNELSVASAWQRDIDCNYRKFFTDTGAVKPPNEWPDEFADCVTEYGTNANGERYIRFADKRGALDRQAKFLKMLPNRQELTDGDGNPLQSAAPVIQLVGYPDEPSGNNQG